MTTIKKYYIINYLTDVKEGFDTIQEAVFAYDRHKQEGGDPIIVTPVTWTTVITDVTNTNSEKEAI